MFVFVFVCLFVLFCFVFAFNAGKMNDEVAIENFSRKYVRREKTSPAICGPSSGTGEKKTYKRKESRKRATLEENQKSFADYNWEAMYRKGTLKKLKVKVLDLYIIEQKLKHRRSTKAKKNRSRKNRYR